MKDKKKSLVFVKKPSELSRKEMFSVTGGLVNTVAGCKCVCDTNNEAKCGNNEASQMSETIRPV